MGLMLAGMGKLGVDRLHGGLDLSGGCAGVNSEELEGEGRRVLGVVLAGVDDVAGLRGVSPTGAAHSEPSVRVGLQ